MNKTESTEDKTRAHPLRTGLLMRCPYCGQGKLFDGFLTLRKSCSGCKADFSAIDSADGPAFFVMFLVSILVVVPAVVVEIKFSPPTWIYPVFFGPLILALCLAFLRPFKGVMIALQVHFKAHEGQAEGEKEGD